MPYLGRSSQKAIRQRFIFTQSSAGATSVSGADDSNATLRFDDGEYIDVILNGITLAKTEYNTLTANTIGGLAALSSGDVLQVTVYDMFNVADVVRASTGGTISGGLTISGNTTITGNLSVSGTGAGAAGVVSASTSGTAISIDSSNRVLFPAQPSFMAYGSWSYDSNYFWKGFTTVDHNIGSHWNNTTGVWTCPIAGRYMIYATMYHDASSSYHLWTFYKNGSTFAPWIQDYNQVSGEHTTSSTAIISCAANDTLQFNSNASYANAYTGGYNKIGVCLIH